MSSPDFQLLLLPFLECIKDGKWHALNDVDLKLQEHIDLSDDMLKSFDPDGKRDQFEVGIATALEHLHKAGLVEKTSPNEVRLTSLGKMVLEKRLNTLDVNFLRKLPGYLDK